MKDRSQFHTSTCVSEAGTAESLSIQNLKVFGLFQKNPKSNLTKDLVALFQS